MKNKFLLLGATALLSTTALVANADFQNPKLDVKARAIFVTGIEIAYPTEMYFGRIDPRGEGSVAIDIDTGQLSGDALLMEEAAPDGRGVIIINGVKGFYEDLTLLGASLTFDEDEITLYEDEKNTSGECATVSDLNYKVGDYSSIGTGSLTIYTSGTLNVDKTYTPTGGYARCTGSVKATYILGDY